MQTVGIHLRGHTQGHESGNFSHGSEIDSSHSQVEMHSLDLAAGAEEGILSCNQIASLERLVLGEFLRQQFPESNSALHTTGLVHESKCCTPRDKAFCMMVPSLKSCEGNLSKRL